MIAMKSMFDDCGDGKPFSVKRMHAVVISESCGAHGYWCDCA